MATQQEILEALSAEIVVSAGRPVSFKEGDDAATHHDFKDLTAALKTLTDPAVVAALSGGTPRDRFVFADHG